MTIEEALWSGCTGYLAINNLIGQRLYPVKLPQNPTYPAVIYRRVSNFGLLTHGGPVGFDTARFQFDYYGANYSDCRSVANAFRTYLEGYTGLMDEVCLSVVVFLNEMDEWGDEVEVYRISQDYKIIYNT